MLSFGSVTAEPKPPGLDTEEIDEAWGEASPAEAPPPPKPAKKRASAKPVKPPTARPLEKPPAGKSRPPRSRKPLPAADEEDPIEYEGDAVTRDSMPTFPHPNPLIYDVPSAGQPEPMIPPAPPVPTVPKKKRK